MFQVFQLMKEESSDELILDDPSPHDRLRPVKRSNCPVQSCTPCDAEEGERLLQIISHHALRSRSPEAYARFRRSGFFKRRRLHRCERCEYGRHWLERDGERSSQTATPASCIIRASSSNFMRASSSARRAACLTTSMVSPCTDKTICNAARKSGSFGKEAVCCSRSRAA